METTRGENEADLAGGEIRQQFELTTNEKKLELVTDLGGLTLRERGRSEQYVSWQDVESLHTAPPAQHLDLHVRESEEVLTIPFGVTGGDGGFDVLLSLILRRTELELRDLELPKRFGRFNTRSIIAWLTAGAAGILASCIIIGEGAHWIVHALIAAMWLVAVWYGGLARECTLTVTRSGALLQKLLSSKEIASSDLSSMSLGLMPSRGGRKLLGLHLVNMEGISERLSCLGAQTIEAYLALRGVIDRGNVRR